MTTIRNNRPLQPAPTAGTSPTAAESTAASPADDAEALPGAEAPPAPMAPRSPPHEVKAAATAARHAMIPTVVSEAAADAALGNLLALKDADLKDVVLDLGAKSPDGLAALLKAASPAYTQGLLGRLERAGAVARAPSLEASAPPQAPQPSAGPALFRHDPSLPKPLRDLVQQANVEATSSYVARYEAYRSEYGAAVDAARTVGELRTLGPVAPPALPENLPTVPGAPMDSAANSAFLDVRGRTVVDRAMMERVANKARALTGQPIAGTSLTLKGEVMLTLSSVSSAGIAADVTRGADGHVTGNALVKAGALGHEVAVTNTGAVSGKAKVGDVSVGTDGVRTTVGITGTTGTDAPIHGVSVSGGASGAGVNVFVGGTGGGIDVDNVRGVAVTGRLAGATGKAAFNGDSIGGGLGYEEEFGTDDTKLKVAVGAGFTAQGVSEIDRAGFIDDDDVGFYDAPPELLRGKAWTSLPADVRRSYQALGWTELEWSSRAGLATALVGRR